MKPTQMSYPTLDLLAQASQTPQRVGRPPKHLDGLTLVEPAVQTPLVYMRDGCVVLYKRPRSDVWQVRFRLFDRKWHRFSTHHRDLEFAKRVAGDLYDRAKFKEELGIPMTTRGFSMVAEVCMRELDKEIEQGMKPMTNRDYKQVIRRYLIPFFGKKSITSIDTGIPPNP